MYIIIKRDLNKVVKIITKKKKKTIHKSHLMWTHIRRFSGLTRTRPEPTAWTQAQGLKLWVKPKWMIFLNKQALHNPFIKWANSKQAKAIPHGPFDTS